MPGFDAAREEWGGLAQRSGNVFQTWEWSELWWRHFGGSGPLRLTAVRGADGELIAILPLHLAAGRPLRTLRFLGHGGAGHLLGPICAPEDRPLAAAALRRLLAETAGRWDLFIGDALPGDEDWGRFLNGRTTARMASPLVPIAGLTWEAYLGARSHNFRKTMGNRERRLAREWGLRYRLADDPARIGDEMSLLHELHERRWAGDLDPRYARASRFELDLARLALDRGWLRLWIMELEGRPAVALYGLRYGGVEWALRFGRDPEPRWGKLSTGMVLLVHAIREAIGDGLREYRLGRGASDYKARFTDEDPGLQQVALAGSITGRAALRVAPAWRAARARYRSRGNRGSARQKSITS